MIGLKLSIIVPVYNVEEYLSSCLDSILCQSYSEFEIICVNDGSTDNSQLVLDEYEAKDNRIKVVIQENKGLSEARNAGLDRASGEWVLFVDSDDKLGCNGVTTGFELHELMSQIEDDIDWIVTTPSVVYEGSTESYKKNDEVMFALPFLGKRSSKDRLVEKINVCAWGKLYRLSVINSKKLRFPVGLRYEDEYWFPCYRLLSQKVKCVPCNLYTYYRRDRGIIYETRQNKDLKSSKELLSIVKAILKFYDENNKIIEYKSYLDLKVIHLYRSSCHLCQRHDVLYCQWMLGDILRELDYPCDSDGDLQDLKKGLNSKKIKYIKKILSFFRCR